MLIGIFFFSLFISSSCVVVSKDSERNSVGDEIHDDCSSWNEKDITAKTPNLGDFISEHHDGEKFYSPSMPDQSIFFIIPIIMLILTVGCICLFCICGNKEGTGTSNSASCNTMINGVTHPPPENIRPTISENVPPFASAPPLITVFDGINKNAANQCNTADEPPSYDEVVLHELNTK